MEFIDIPTEQTVILPENRAIDNLSYRVKLSTSEKKEMEEINLDQFTWLVKYYSRRHLKYSTQLKWRTYAKSHRWLSLWFDPLRIGR